MANISCPCCGDPMQTGQVVCWTCYRITNKLASGTHLDPDGTTATDQGYAVTITEEQIAQWDKARNERIRQGDLEVAKNVPCLPCADELADLVAERDLKAEPFHLG